MPNEHLLLSGVTDAYYCHVRDTGYLAIDGLQASDVVAVETDPTTVDWARCFALVNISDQWDAAVQPYRTIVIMQDNRVFKLKNSPAGILRILHQQGRPHYDAMLRQVMAPVLGSHRNVAYVASDLCLLPVDQEAASNHSWVNWQPAEMNWDYRPDGTMLTRLGSVPLLWSVSAQRIKRRVRNCRRLVSYLQGYGRALLPSRDVLGKGARLELDAGLRVHKAVRLRWARRLVSLVDRVVDIVFLRLGLREIEVGDYSRMPEV